MSPPPKNWSKEKKLTGEGRERTKPIKPNRAPKKAQELSGGEGRQQLVPGTKASTVPKRGR